MTQGKRHDVGQFTIDENGGFWGPKQYMEEQGNERLNKILSGKDEVFNMSAHLSPDMETALLVWMQTDYAGWKGFKEAQSWCKPRQ